jgi:hypothetical protein
VGASTTAAKSGLCDGSDARKLAGRSEDPAFSPDGRRIAFASDRNENGSLNYGDKAFFANEPYIPARQAIPERPIQHGHASERRRELPATGARPPTAGSQVCSSRLAAGRRSGTGWPAGRHGVAGTGWTGWASGAAGPPDASGAPGATNVVVRLGAPVTIEAPDPQNLTASCEPGERALGGGVAPQSAVNEEVRIICSTPMRGGSVAAKGDIPYGWRTRVGIIGAGAYAAIPRVVCASP